MIPVAGLFSLLIAGISNSWAGVEEQRIAKARTQLPEVVDRYRAVVDRAAAVSGPVELMALGKHLWREAVADVQVGQGDDRALYWSRLIIRKLLIEQASLAEFELASRGMTDIEFPDEACRRVLITGFDPFHLDDDISQSNPSGLAALSLDGTSLDGACGPARIEAAVIPVRFADFDEGLIETFFRPYLASGIDLVVTISMGRDAFDLERFPGRRRSAEVPDNRNVLTGATASTPLIPQLAGERLEGPEFVEFSLPAESIGAVGGPWPVRDNRKIVTLERGAFAATGLASLDGLTAVSGSGGGYLSNEISYRVVRLARALGATTRVGHLHTPRVGGYDQTAELDMVEQIRRILLAAVNASQ